VCIARHKTHAKTTISPPSRAGYGVMLHTQSGNLLNSMSKYYQKFQCDARHWTTHLQTTIVLLHHMDLLCYSKYYMNWKTKRSTQKYFLVTSGTRCHSSLALQLDREKVNKRLEHLLPHPPPLFEWASINIFHIQQKLFPIQMTQGDGSAAWPL
jgi:hypothetical protein